VYIYPPYEPRYARIGDEERSLVREHFLTYCRNNGVNLEGVEDAYRAAGEWLADVIPFYVPAYLPTKFGRNCEAPPPEKSLLIYGEVGRGKTFLARKIHEFYCGVCGTYSGKVKAVFVYDTEFTLGSAIKGNDYLDDFFFGNERKILFFDDIGNEDDSRQFGNVYSGREILRYRHICQEKWSVPTVLTTNLTRNALADRYGIYVESRVSGYYKGIRLRYPKDRRKGE
jgi:hypothetical protein